MCSWLMILFGICIDNRRLASQNRPQKKYVHIWVTTRHPVSSCSNHPAFSRQSVTHLISERRHDYFLAAGNEEKFFTTPTTVEKEFSVSIHGPISSTKEPTWPERIRATELEGCEPISAAIHCPLTSWHFPFWSVLRTVTLIISAIECIIRTYIDIYASHQLKTSLLGASTESQRGLVN